MCETAEEGLNVLETKFSKLLSVIPALMFLTDVYSTRLFLLVNSTVIVTIFSYTIPV